MDPIERFQRWFAEARDVPRAALPDPTAMALGTVDGEGRPSVRIVLLKGVDTRGFVFYTNFLSRKGRELSENARAALCIHWAPLERQVRVEGLVEPVSAQEADAYFASRARDSQIGAWASFQSETLANEELLLDRVREMEARFASTIVPRPPHWSGVRVVPFRIEFWTGRPHRLHDRELYERSDVSAGWTVRRLYP